SCGDGNFLEALQKLRLNFKSVTAIELDEIEYFKSRRFSSELVNIVNDDFHRYCLSTEKKFDLVVGNPPYIRYQFFNKEQQGLAQEVFEKSQLKYSKLANAW